VISNRGIEVPGISLIKDFDKAQREYHQAWVAGDTNQETTPFVWSLVLCALATLAVAASIHPYVILPSVTVTAVASPTQTLITMLMVVSVILPVMLIYNGYQYRVFRGKTTAGYGE
jgi:cytochrome bd-type quinol oxidase subunit 2